jgi:hypothetical protein
MSYQEPVKAEIRRHGVCNYHIRVSLGWSEYSWCAVTLWGARRSARRFLRKAPWNPKLVDTITLDGRTITLGGRADE